VPFSDDSELIGREQELVQLRGFVSGIAEAPRAVLIRGGPGIGKTTLWNVTLEEARAAGLSVLSARSVETELPLGLVGLSDLLAGALEPVEQDLPDHQRAALAVAMGLEAPRGASPDALALSRAFLALVRAHAARGPVLLALDDTQWLDEASRRVVSFAVRRLRDAPVGVVATQRGDGPDALDLAQAFDERLFREIRLGGLSVGALAHLVRRRLDTRISRPLVARLHAASGGNPMFALEFARRLSGDSSRQLAPLPLPASLEELVRTRVVAFPPRVRRLLAAAAAVERPTPALLRSIEPAAEQLLDVATDAGAVVFDDDVVRFAHPLLAAAVYAELAPSEKRALHGRLAEVAGDVEERARHLALASAEPEAEVSAIVADAAARAHARGAPEAAAELAREAVRLTRPDAEDLLERRLAVAEYLSSAGRTIEACEWLDQLLAGALAGPPRARTLMLRCAAEHDIEVAGRLLAEAVEHVGDDAALRAHLLLMLSAHFMYLEDPDLAASEQAAREAVELAERVGDAALLAAGLSMVADRADLAAHPDDSLFERAIELEDAQGSLPLFFTARERLARVLLRRGDLSAARDLLEPTLERAIRTGAVPDRCRVSVELFDLEWRAGNWERAERYLDDAWNVAVEEAGDPWGEAELPVKRARLEALRGNVEGARELVAQGVERAAAIHWERLAAQNRWVLGFLELSLGNATEAWLALEDVSHTRVRGSLEVLDVLEAAADAVEALVALDRLEAAEGLLAVLEAEAARGHRWARPASDRCSALLRVARGETIAAVVAAEKAADGFDAAGFPLDRARSLFVAGEALRRAGRRREAAKKLDAAQDVFLGLGAALWVARAETELRRARPRPRRDRELTDAERRVAALVAQGRSNREVAAQLFTTVATVEAHLTRIYRKLGVRSRTELARRTAEGTVSLNP
jgi:DNA-binding CsgD family transcriptional regulator